MFTCNCTLYSKCTYMMRCSLGREFGSDEVCAGCGVEVKMGWEGGDGGTEVPH